ncbi:MAG: hypothetical protein K2Q25_09175 [Mycobacteriaceae bacterium]|nr:hypothetical protein [Mycobacteriaceae bacterium]
MVSVLFALYMATDFYDDFACILESLILNTAQYAAGAAAIAVVVMIGLLIDQGQHNHKAIRSARRKYVSVVNAAPPQHVPTGVTVHPLADQPSSSGPAVPDASGPTTFTRPAPDALTRQPHHAANLSADQSQDPHSLKPLHGRAQPLSPRAGQPAATARRQPVRSDASQENLPSDQAIIEDAIVAVEIALTAPTPGLVIGNPAGPARRPYAARTASSRE